MHYDLINTLLYPKGVIKMKKIKAADAQSIIKSDIESVLNDHIVDYKLYECLHNFSNDHLLDDYIPSYIAQFYVHEYNLRLSRMFSAASKYSFFDFSIEGLEVSLVPHEYELPFPSIIKSIEIQKGGSCSIELNVSLMAKHYEFVQDDQGDLHIDFLM